MACQVRALTEFDASTALELVRRFHSSCLQQSRLASVLGNPANLLLVAEDAGRTIGFLFAHWLDRLRVSESQLFIYEVEVEPEQRRVGVGSALVASALARARERRARAFVFTNQSNAAAIALYRKLGGSVKNGDDLLFVFPGA